MTGAGGAFTTRRLSWATRLSSRRLARGRAGAAIAACALARTPPTSAVSKACVTAGASTRGVSGRRRQVLVERFGRGSPFECLARPAVQRGGDRGEGLGVVAGGSGAPRGG